MWFLGLVVDVGVQGQFAQERAGGGVDDADVAVVDEESNVFAFVGASDADVVHF